MKHGLFFKTFSIRNICKLRNFIPRVGNWIKHSNQCLTLFPNPCTSPNAVHLVTGPEVNGRTNMMDVFDMMIINWLLIEHVVCTENYYMAKFHRERAICAKWRILIGSRSGHYFSVQPAHRNQASRA